MLFALVPLDELGRKGMGGLQVGKQPILVGADPMTGENWHNCDDPWGCYLQGPGNPAENASNPQAHTTWVPVDWNSWPNYNVHGYGVY